MKRAVFVTAAALSISILGAGCKNDHDHDTDSKKTTVNAPVNAAVCNVEPTKGNKAKGIVTFAQKGDKVTIVAHITGLTPNQKHGFHIHEGTECGEDGALAKGHYNPEKHDHGSPDKPMRHAGDLGNIEADADGVAHLEITVDNITIDGAKNPVLGHAIIVHAKADDFSQPVGAAGARIGCGLIKASDKPNAK